VAPLRIARGTQNKVLEALAMARPVVCTPAAASGVDVSPGRAFRVADTATSFADEVIALLAHGENRDGRRSVIERYRWATNLRIVDDLLAHPVPSDPPEPAIA
jgi:glycosyltransferase involved in cell wall biosynthesis